MTRRYIRNTSSSQPFSNPTTNAHERSDRYPGNDISSNQWHIRVESTDKSVAISYLAP